MKNVKLRTEKRSFCQHEFEVMDCRSISVIEHTPVPSLRMLSLSLATITQSSTNQTVVCAACATVYDHVSCTTTSPDYAKKPHHSASVLFGLVYHSSGFIQLSHIHFSSNLNYRKTG